MRFLSFLFFLLALAPLPAIAQDKVFDADTFFLENGMQVVVIENHRAPVVTHMVWYKVGAADEPPGKSGMAHFFEHMMFKGTDTIPPGEFSKRIRAMGGNDNAFTSQDYTAFFQSLAVENLETAMAMEADRMRNLNPPPDDFASELQVVIEERRQRTENEPQSYFVEQLRAALFVNHPYANPVVGWLQEVDVLSWENAKAFYDQWYAPNNAILVVSGDITAAELKPMAERTYGKLAARDVPERHWTDVPPLPGLPVLTLKDKAIRQPAWIRIYRLPSATQDRETARTLEVLQDIMDGGAATRLYKVLVVDQKVATSIGLSYDPDSIKDASLWMQATPAPGKTLQDVAAAVDEQLRLLVTAGVTETELREAKDRMKDAAVYARDSLAGPAMVVGRALAAGQTLDDVETWPDQIEAVTAEQIQRAAQAFLDPDDIKMRPYVTGYMLPKEEQE
ncbi:MAG: insulinase family protein [Rhodospirillales bacterium]|nr:insulinase family protein [Rhodospirillales bacterium]